MRIIYDRDAMPRDSKDDIMNSHEKRREASRLFSSNR